MKLYKCDNGYYYKGPEKSCLFCIHCTDIFYDYSHGPYMFICDKNLEYTTNCEGFEEDKEDPNIIIKESF